MSFPDVLLQHPFNPVSNHHDHSDTDKSWAHKYRSIKKLRMHTDANGPPDWSPLADVLSDDPLRRSASSVQTNPRALWELANENDGESYFDVEILPPVLSKFQTFPKIHTRSFPSDHGKNKIDCALMWAENIAVIGEYKRNLIDRRIWEAGSLEKKKTQEKLSRELRG